MHLHKENGKGCGSDILQSLIMQLKPHVRKFEHTLGINIRPNQAHLSVYNTSRAAAFVTELKSSRRQHWSGCIVVVKSFGIGIWRELVIYKSVEMISQPPCKSTNSWVHSAVQTSFFLVTNVKIAYNVMQH